MSTPIVPSVGPALSSGGGDLVNAGCRQTTNAAPVAPAPATTAPIFAPGELISVRTTQTNEKVRATLCIDRANPGGNGTYQITVDGVGVGPARFSTLTPGPDGSTIIDALINVATPGVHTVGAQVTSLVAPETVNPGAALVVQANQFA